MQPKQPGLFLQAGPPIHLLCIFKIDVGHLGEMRYNLTPEQAVELGTILIQLAGVSEVAAPDRTARPADNAFLRAEMN